MLDRLGQARDREHHAGLAPLLVQLGDREVDGVVFFLRVKLWRAHHKGSFHLCTLRRRFHMSLAAQRRSGQFLALRYPALLASSSLLNGTTFFGLLRP